MKELKTYLNDNLGMRLNKLEFKRLDEPSGETAELYVDDSFEISEVEDKMFAISLKRCVHCKPASIMDICIEFEIARFIDDSQEVNIKDFDLKIEISEDNIDEYIDNNFNRAAALISGITSGFGMSPLITPPIFVKRDNG